MISDVVKLKLADVCSDLFLFGFRMREALGQEEDAVKVQHDVDEIFQNMETAAHQAGTLKEIFGSGTAAVISPVGELKYGDRVLTVGDGQVGPLSRRLYRELVDIQYGRSPDPMAWIESV